ncbi:MauE/DoxX family redox-associated membrane protein [Micromonospora sagamiensis]|uniref:Methylamine utilization protein MauE n=1 Tax=Micromonospora sagamiensis TaxID=47875 RepID=A0A562WJP5_9ACTN|nr:MauE/DoxX family redox-associated membrane protein [Micromonospora sagamiensis]TWJ30426.1 methylamine utilization protein MauE [Micromonospora sagamiensis]BCL16544.1 methylamine utilization protein MauE [Micromonospora sagamiensis]
MPYLVTACQGLLAVVLLVSATSKLRSGQALRVLAGSLAAMRLVPPRWAEPVAAVLAVAEAVAVVLLLIPATRRVGFGAAAALLAVLAAGVAVVLARGTAQPCRCFGASATPLGRRHLVRNVVLCLAAFAGLVGPAGPAVPAGTLLALLAGAVAGLLVTVLDDIVALLTPMSRTDLSKEMSRWRT